MIMIHFLCIEGLIEPLKKLQNILKKNGTASILKSAPNVEALLELAKTHKPELLFLSLNTLEENDIKICRQWKKDNSISHIPVVFTYSDATDNELRMKALEEGANAFLSLPIDEINWLTQVKLLLQIKKSSKLDEVTQTLLDRATDEIESLKKKEKQFYDIFNSMSEGFSIQDVICDEAGNPIDLMLKEANLAFDKQTGLKHEQTKGRSLLEIFPSSEDYWIQRYGKVGITGEPTSFEAMFGPLNTIYHVNVFQTAAKQIGVLFTDINERKLAENELRQSEEKFKSLMQQSPFAVELYNMDGLQTSVNRAYEELWNFPTETTVNKFNLLKSKEVLKSGLMDYIKRAYAGESVKVPEYQFDSRGDTEAKGEGRVRWLNTRIYPIKDKKDQVQNIVIVHQDISERKKSEHELSQSIIREKFMADVYRDSSVGITIGYANGRLGMCNLAYQAITGYTEEELQKINWNTVLTPPKWEKLETIKLKELHRTKKPVRYEKEYIKKDGAIIPVELIVHPRLDNKGEVEYYFAFVTDTSKEKEILVSLKNSEIRYKTLFDDSPIPLWEEDFSELVIYFNSLKKKGIKDLHTYLEEYPDELLACTKMIKVIDVNHSAIALYQAESKEELIGKLNAIFTNSSFRAFKEELIAVFNGKDYFETEAEIKTLKGEFKNIHLVLKVNQTKGESGRALLVTSDITKRKKAEILLKESESNVTALINNTDDSIWSLDRDFKHLIFNKTYAAFFLNSYGLELKKGLDVKKYLSESQYQFWMSQFNATLNGEKMVFEVSYNFDGSEYHFQTSLNPIYEDNEITGISARSVNISEQKESEEKINKQLNELQRWHDAMINREEKTLELKIEINRLLQKLGKPIKYSSVSNENLE